jgi:hypothetical protein
MSAPRVKIVSDASPNITRGARQRTERLCAVAYHQLFRHQERIP